MSSDKLIHLEIWETIGLVVPNFAPIQKHDVIASGDCVQCGKPMMILDNGVALHLNGDEVDFDADADHTAYLEQDDESTQPAHLGADPGSANSS